MAALSKIAFGGGCHWCTEAVFQSLFGVEQVEQGFVASKDENRAFSEAVIVHFNPKQIHLETLIEIHLNTHKRSSLHSMRKKYRSAIYTFTNQQALICKRHLSDLQDCFKTEIITRVMPFKSFKPSRKQIQNYYFSNPEKPFCKTYINPKLQLLINSYSGVVNHNRLAHLKNQKK
ncbi:peptide-methionine (S)-S-oxide reductase [Flavobacteriaceae bacterium GSB9]|nr:peptide-methionine (S)-S-oxide reductase [Flavobacteriaceae bacterium GSB9]